MIAGRITAWVSPHDSQSNGVEADCSRRDLCDLDDLYARVAGYDQLIMNVRSYTFPFAFQAAKIFKQVNPNGLVITGGMHATVARTKWKRFPAFDRICQGPGENIIVDLLKIRARFRAWSLVKARNPCRTGKMMDRTMWPNPNLPEFPWPLERNVVGDLVRSRQSSRAACVPGNASFAMRRRTSRIWGRKSVDQVIDELNFLDDKFGPIGSFVIHDSMFFQSPRWLQEWIEKYPRKAHKRWSYWAAGRSDTVRQWPDLFEALVRETNWNIISIGFESGSDRVLKS